MYYLGAYFPKVASWLVNTLGPNRVKVFRRGGDDYDIVAVLKEGWKKEETT